jgi:hypothetical protein
VDPAVLEKLASASNICLGETTDEFSSTISTIQAKENANAVLRAAKIRLSDQQKQSCDEGGSSDNLTVEREVDKREGTGKNIEGEADNRPPKKPPKRRGNDKAQKAGKGAAKPT